MTQAQYADMVSIMQISRQFCDQMLKCMDNHGLTKQGFTLTLRIGDRKLFSGDVETGCIELEQDIMEDEYSWEKNRMVQRKVNSLKRWMVDNDPLAEEGTVPPMVADIKASAKDVGNGTGEDSSKPNPLDNTWFSIYDYPADVDGGK